MNNYHITKNDGEWSLKMERSSEVLISSKTKEEIIAKTREYMSDKMGSVKIHKEDGRIQEERTYPRSADPRGSKG